MRSILVLGLMVLSSAVNAAPDKAYCEKPMQVLSNVYYMMGECDYPESLQGAYNRRNFSSEMIVTWAKCYPYVTGTELVEYLRKSKEVADQLFSKNGKPQTCTSLGM